MQPRRISDARYQEFKGYIGDLLYDKNILQIRGLVKWQHRLARYLGFKEHYEKVKDIENYLQHTFRIAIESYLYSLNHGGDPRAAARAAIYHDVGKIQGECRRGRWRYLPLVGDGHAKYSAEYAKGKGEDKKVVDAIESHMFPMRAYPPPRSTEDRALWIADKKDAIKRDKETSKLGQELYQEMVKQHEEKGTGKKKILATLILISLIPFSYFFLQKSSITLQAVDANYLNGISVVVSAVIAILLLNFYKKSGIEK